MPNHPYLSLPARLWMKPAGTEKASRPETGDAWSDDALVEAIIRRGSQQHFGALMARYKVKVHQIALSVLGPGQQALAEDVAQEVFIKLYQRLESFRGDCLFSTWLYRMAFNTAIDIQRRSRKFTALDIDSIAPVVAEDSTGSDIDNAGSARRIHAAIQSLPQTQRMMVYLFYWLELRIREIATVMDCPEGTVKVYLSRAKAALAKQLG
jgi:RNA polymerase sigma-70 factor (ECF subfamily)